MSIDQRVAAATPVRQANPDARAGRSTLLRDVGSSYRDGAEGRLLDIVLGSDDLGSLNEELHAGATDWPERYHLDRQRANVLRAFDLCSVERALEVGAGCGAMSRYLAEVCPMVDALEPVPTRAAVAAARLRDLPGARVFAGELADLPDEPSYDLVVVIGVLEYVAGGAADEAPYVAFLDDIRRRLLPGGRLLLAIENKLGVKYLAGAPEDHSDRPFDSLEGYPIGTPARTFDRTELARLFDRAGFGSRFFGAFPDYKLTRVVMSDALMTDPSELAARLPRFPSPDWQSPRDFGPNEELLWRSLVSAGHGPVHANSFVVLASPDGSPDGSPDDLWPTAREGAFFSTDRRPGRATQTLVERQGDRLVLHRTALGRRRDEQGPAQRVASGPVLPGRPLVEVIAEGDVARTGRLLQQWRAMVEASAAETDGVAIDLVPHNLLLHGDDSLVYIDDEWHSTEWSPDDVVARGLLWLCERLSTVPSPWQARTSRRVLLAELADLIGFTPQGDWVTTAVRREAELQVELLRRGREQKGYAEEVGRSQRELAGLLDLPMDPVRPKVSTALEELAAFRREHEARVGEMRADIERTHAALAAAHAELASIHGSLGYGAVVGLHRGVERVIPPGTWRRSFYTRIARALRRARRG